MVAVDGIVTRGHFPLPPFVVRHAFAVRITAFTLGAIVVNLLLGFRTPDAGASFTGVFFPNPFGAVNQLEVQSNNAIQILPPWVTVQVDTQGGPATLTYQILAALEYEN